MPDKKGLFSAATKRFVATDAKEGLGAVAGVYGNELTGVPVQPELLHKENASMELEGSTALNSLPMSLEGASSADMKYVDEDGIKRSGSTLTACAHVITAVIGAGVLSLPYAMASLGWILGCVCFVLFAAITLYTSQLLADLYIIDGKRQRTYIDMVETCYGRSGKIIIGSVQQSNLVLTALAYTITAGTSCVALATSYCETHNSTSCFNSFWEWAVIFGGLQLFLSQTPNLESFWWASMVGASMSIIYSTILLVLALVYFDTKGTAGPADVGDTADIIWNICNGIGSILFAYSFSMILIEIQDTVRTRKGSTTGPIRPMKRAVNFSVAVMTTYYIAIAVFGYLSQGNGVQPWVLDSFPDAPVWVIDLANAAVLVHMIPAYQVWSQPHFEWVDMTAERHGSKNSWLGGWKLRLWYRTIYVILITFLACLMPWFGIIVGIVGAIGFWPATVFYPIECWIKVFKPKKTQMIFMRTLDVFCAIVTLFALIGSIQLLVANVSTFKPFET